MRSRKKLFPFLFLSIACFVGLTFYTYVFDPEILLVESPVPLSPLLPFFLLLFIGAWGLLSFILKNKRQALFISIFLNVLLLLRLFKFDSIIYPALILLILVLIEILFWRRNEVKSAHGK